MALRLMEEDIVATSALKRWDMIQQHVEGIQNGLLLPPADQQDNISRRVAPTISTTVEVSTTGAGEPLQVAVEAENEIAASSRFTGTLKQTSVHEHAEADVSTSFATCHPASPHQVSALLMDMLKNRDDPKVQAVSATALSNMIVPGKLCI